MVSGISLPHLHAQDFAGSRSAFLCCSNTKLSMVRVRMIRPTIATRKPMTKKMRQPQALKFGRRHQRFYEDDRAEAEQQPDRDREADPGAPEGAVLRSRRLFDHPGRGGAELGAETDALQQPEDDEQHRGDGADAGVGRRQSDRQRAQAHQHQRVNQRVLAAVAVGHVAENIRADRTDDDAETVGGDRRGNGAFEARLFEENVRPIPLPRSRR